MALRNATLFKDFRIVPSIDNDRVTCYMTDPLTVPCKSDNFATSITILNNTGAALYDYRYITIDGTNVFEIVGALRNGNMWNLSVNYVSEFIFGSEDLTRHVSGVSVSTLQKLGLSISEFFGIIGNQTTVAEKNITTQDFSNRPPFIFAVKISFSEIPQNLNKYADAGGEGTTAIVGQIPSPTMSKTIPRNLALSESMDLKSVKDFAQIDESTNVLLPIPLTPLGQDMTLTITDGAGHSNDLIFNIPMFVEALGQLITDLTLSVELTVIDSKSIVVGYQSNPAASLTTKYMTITSQKITIQSGDTIGEMVRYIQGNNAATTTSRRQPCLVLKRAIHTYSGLYEVYNFINMQLPDIGVNEARTNLLFLNNDIDISSMRDDNLYIQRLEHGLRIWVDLLRNNYVDIATTIEFDKNAYSNYFAYKQANIELAQRQELDAFKLQRAQQLLRYNVDFAFSELSASGDVIGSVLEGEYGEAVSSAVNYRLGSVQGGINFAMQQAFAGAYFKLKQAQQHQSALRTIIPSSRINGSLSLLSALNCSPSAPAATTIYTVKSVILSQTQLRAIEKYILDSKAIDRVTDLSDIVFPLWQTLRQIGGMQIQLENTDANMTRVDAIVRGHSQKNITIPAKKFTLGKGAIKTPYLTIINNTYAITDLSSNTNATISMITELSETGTYSVIVFLNPIPTIGEVDFDTFFQLIISGLTRTTTGEIPAFKGTEADRIKTFVPVNLGSFSLPKFLNLGIYSTTHKVDYAINVQKVVLLKND